MGRRLRVGDERGAGGGGEPVSQLVYLVAALLLSGVLSGFLWYRHQRPKSLQGGIEDFAKELRALAPDRGGDPRRRDR